MKRINLVVCFMNKTEEHRKYSVTPHLIDEMANVCNVTTTLRHKQVLSAVSYQTVILVFTSFSRLKV